MKNPIVKLHFAEPWFFHVETPEIETNGSSTVEIEHSSSLTNMCVRCSEAVSQLALAHE